MMSSSAAFLYLFALALLVMIAQISARPVCYSGSSMYQLVTQDCATKDKSYNGTWYCAKMEICESFMNKNRECITTRGCATSEECVDSSSATGYYNGNKVQVSSGVNPAGMTVTATCCKAYEFSDDDTIAINYDDICNSASSIKMSSTFVVGIATIVALAQYMLYQ